MDLAAQKADDVFLSTVHNNNNMSMLQWLYERVQLLLWQQAHFVSALEY